MSDIQSQHGFFATPINEPGSLFFITKKGSAKTPAHARWHQGVRFDLMKDAQISAGGLTQVPFVDGMIKLRAMTHGFNPEYATHPLIAQLRLEQQAHVDAGRLQQTGEPYRPGNTLKASAPAAEAPRI